MCVIIDILQQVVYIVSGNCTYSSAVVILWSFAVHCT